MDKAQLEGNRIEMHGYASFGGPILTFSVNPESSVGVYIDPARLPKADQRNMIARCTDEPCQVTIRGLVAETPGKFGEVRAEAVTFGKR